MYIEQCLLKRHLQVIGHSKDIVCKGFLHSLLLFCVKTSLEFSAVEKSSANKVAHNEHKAWCADLVSRVLLVKKKILQGYIFGF